MLLRPGWPGPASVGVGGPQPTRAAAARRPLTQAEPAPQVTAAQAADPQKGLCARGTLIPSPHTHCHGGREPGLLPRWPRVEPAVFTTRQSTRHRLKTLGSGHVGRSISPSPRGLED